MIKLERGEKPDALENSQQSWQDALNLAILRYGSYTLIPKREKETLVSHYRNDFIKVPLFESSNSKCAFCECKPAEGGNIEVEHFRPKSIYPLLTFEWTNFLPCCSKCNTTKSNHDTATSPIINPYDTDPELILYYEDIRIKPRDENALAKNTIAVCGLNSVRLMRPRGDILSSLHDFAEAIENAIEDFNSCTTDLRRRNRLRRITESIERIELLANRSERYSGYCKSYLNGCAPYQMAKKLIADNSE